MTVAWTGHGIESVPRGPSVSNVPAGRVPQPVPVAQTSYTAPPGASAYEVAVANGFVGTEAEWLASLAATGPLTDHIDATRPHIHAESGRDFAGWFDALTT